MTTISRQNQTCILTLEAARPGGVPTVIDGWVSYLEAWGYQPTVLYGALGEDGLSRSERLRWTVDHWQLHQRDEHPHPTLANAAMPIPLWLMYFQPQWMFSQVLEQFDQIVFAGGPGHAGLPAAIKGLPYVVWTSTLYEDELRGKLISGDAWAKNVLESPMWPFLRWQEHFVLQRANRVVVHSPYVARRIAEDFPDIVPKLSVATVPIDLKRNISPEDIGSPYILNVSRINDVRKNIPMLMEAYAIIREAHPDVKLVLVGEEPGDVLRKKHADLGLSDNVIYTGRVSEEQRTAYYAGAELFMMSSTQEGLGIVMLEAMACGTPVVATDCGGPEGIVIDGETGRIVLNNDAEAMAAAGVELLGQPELIQHLGEGSLRYIEQNCSYEVVGQVLYDAFASTFPDSPAAHKKIYPLTSTSHINDKPKKTSLKSILIAAWAVLITAAYFAQQLRILWPSIRTQLISP